MSDLIHADDLAGAGIADVGGLLVDTDTGEILGITRDRSAREVGAPAFRVDDRASAEWVLEKIFDAESEMNALDRRLEIITRNVEAQKQEHERRATWLRERFGAELEAWARDELASTKKRSLRTPFGKLSFRKRASRLVVKDETEAIAWAESAGIADCVKVSKKFLVSGVAFGDVPPGCEVEPERDSFRIDTGVE